MYRGSATLRVLCAVALLLAAACKKEEPPPPPPPKPAPVEKKPEPVAEVVKKDGTFVLQLTRPMEEALKRSQPQFKVWEVDDFFSGSIKSYKVTRRQVPWGVVGDFNGDGVRDALLLGRDPQYKMRLVILSGPDGFTVEVLSRRRFVEIEGRKGMETYVEYFRPATVREYVDPEFVEEGEGWKKRIIPNDAFKEVYDEVGGTVYFLEDGKWQEVVPAG